MPWPGNCAAASSKTGRMARDKAPPADAFASESEMIEAVFAPLTAGAKGAFGLVDDAALLSAAPGEERVLTCDMLVEDVHFLKDTAPADIGWKSLAVNVSDLVAKGADPETYLLSIALPRHLGRGWLSGFAEGLKEAQDAFGCHLAGGDTTATPGPLTISITALGTLPEGTMVHRSGAKPSDRVYVTSTIGDAVAGLHLLRQAGRESADDAAFLIERHRRPRPQPAIAPVIRAYANAAMDVSDGLAGDFAKLCAASACGGTIEAARVPLSPAARALVETEKIALETLISGGDDYCVLASVPPEQCEDFEASLRDKGGKVSCIGAIDAGSGINIVGANGEAMRLSRPGFDHFAS